MSENTYTRPARIATLKEAIGELERARLSMGSALRESNDQRHHEFFEPVLDRLGAIISNEREGITFSLADDLAIARSAIRRLRLPDIDPDFDMPTPALRTLRGERGNLVEAIDNALEAAALLRMLPRNMDLSGMLIDHRDIAGQLSRLDNRLRRVTEAVSDLENAAIGSDIAADLTEFRSDAPYRIPRKGAKGRGQRRSI